MNEWMYGWMNGGINRLTHFDMKSVVLAKPDK